jgi:hypothetical protein
MFDSSRSSELQPVRESERVQDLQPVRESDFMRLIEALQAMQTSQLQAMQEVQRESLQVTVETLHHLTGVKATQRSPRVKAGEQKTVAISARRSGSAYEEPITALWMKNPHITAVEAGKKVGCSHVTAATILKALRAVKVTPVESGASEDESGSSASESA